MSGLFAGKVWHSALEAHLKPVAAALADEARDDGSNCRPSLDLIVWKLGLSRRAVQTSMKALREQGILRAVCHAECQETPGAAHGRGQPVHYSLLEEALPTRPSWTQERERLRLLREEKGEESAPFQIEKDAEPAPFVAEKGAVQIEKGAVGDAKGCSPTSGDPYSVDPSEIYDPEEKITHTPRALRLLEPLAADPEPPAQPYEPLLHPPLEHERILAALHEQTTRLVFGGADAPATGWCEDLVRRGATLSDVEYAVQSTLQRGKRSTAYVRTVLEGRVQEREQGITPRISRGRPANAMRADPAHAELAAGVVVVGAMPDGRPIRKRDVARGHLEDGTPLPAEVNTS